MNESNPSLCVNRQNQRSVDEHKELINVTDREKNVGAEVRLRSQAIPSWIYRR